MKDTGLSAGHANRKRGNSQDPMHETGMPFKFKPTTKGKCGGQFSDVRSKLDSSEETATTKYSLRTRNRMWTSRKSESIAQRSLQNDTSVYGRVFWSVSEYVDLTMKVGWPDEVITRLLQLKRRFNVKHRYNVILLDEEAQAHQEIFRVTSMNEKIRLQTLNKEFIGEQLDMNDTLDGLAYIKECDMHQRSHNLLPVSKKELRVATFGRPEQRLDELSIAPANPSDGFRAPETLHENPKASSDIFSLGVVLSMLFSQGRHPFGMNPAKRCENISDNRVPDLFPMLDPHAHRKAYLLDLVDYCHEIGPSMLHCIIRSHDADLPIRSWLLTLINMCLRAGTWVDYVSEHFGLPRDELRRLQGKFGYISLKQKIETLREWLRKTADYDYWALIEMAEAFGGKGINQDIYETKVEAKILREIVRLIPGQKWMRFVRLDLCLDRETIQRLHQQYAEFNQEQKDHILSYWFKYSELPGEDLENDAYM